MYLLNTRMTRILTIAVSLGDWRENHQCTISTSQDLVLIPLSAFDLVEPLLRCNIELVN